MEEWKARQSLEDVGWGMPSYCERGRSFHFWIHIEGSLPDGVYKYAGRGRSLHTYIHTCIHTLFENKGL